MRLVRCSFDYLQRIDSKESDMMLRVLTNVDKAKMLAQMMGCPVFLGVQAGRQSLQRDFKLPTLSDAQHSSRIEQDADKVLSLWIPSKTEPIGKMLSPMRIQCTRDLLIVGIRKQRGSKSGQVIPLKVDWARNDITDMFAPDDPAYGF